jgi:hypothetical protein
MQTTSEYRNFTTRLKLLVQHRPDLITVALSNIFTMRLIGNKTHGDLAEIGISEFVNQYMYDFSSTHVGKDLFRAKSQEEDITVRNDVTESEFPISLKAYGLGPLQLSTDKSSRMFTRLSQESADTLDSNRIRKILQDPAFSGFREINVLPLIYDETTKKCNIMVFDSEKALENVSRIELIGNNGRRKHPIFKFTDSDGNYICEVRYGDAAANALQRGLWTHTRHGIRYFDSITNGWIDYSHNTVLVQLFSHALVASQTGHQDALEAVRSSIRRLQEGPEEENI